MDPLLLARMQFAANITFHILFPTISIALGWLLLFFRWRWLRATRDAAAQGWLDAYRFWTKVFALTFALGVVSGITMSFQFGTNWPGFMEQVGNIAGPLLGYEVLTAFFLEAGFLGVMLFGHGKVSERVHLMATFLVAFGTTLSARSGSSRSTRGCRRRPATRSSTASSTSTSWLDGDLQPVVPVPPHAHAAGLGADRARSCSPGCRPGSCCAASAQRSAPQVLRVGADARGAC